MRALPLVLFIATMLLAGCTVAPVHGWYDDPNIDGRGFTGP